MHLQDVIVRYQLRVVTAISTIHPESAERLHMEQAVRTAILHRAARRAAVPHQIVRAANITATIRMIPMTTVTMMSTWMAIMIRTVMNGMMETKGTGKEKYQGTSYAWNGKKMV